LGITITVSESETETERSGGEMGKTEREQVRESKCESEWREANNTDFIVNIP